jgi:hypothetical protein
MDLYRLRRFREALVDVTTVVRVRETAKGSMTLVVDPDGASAVT